MPAAGRLDRLVTIERHTKTQDANGFDVETWTTWREVWMGKKDIRAVERFRSQQELAEETTVWVSHWVEGLTPKDRLSVEGKTYDIVGLAEIGRRAGLEITATAVRIGTMAVAVVVAAPAVTSAFSSAFSSAFG